MIKKTLSNLDMESVIIVSFAIGFVIALISYIL
jgi:hypothetical protein